MLRPGLWRSDAAPRAQRRRENFAGEDASAKERGQVWSTAGAAETRTQEDLEALAERGLAELRKQLAPSPNDLSVLFAPHLAYTCTFVKNEPLRRPRFEQTQPWNQNVQLERSRDEPSMEHGAPHRDRRKSRKRTEADRNRTLQATVTSQTRQNARLRPNVRSKRQRHEMEQSTMPTAHETMASSHEQDLRRLIVLREGLLSQARTLRGPLAAGDANTLVRDLARVSLLVVESIVKRSSALLASKGAAVADKTMELGFVWNGANYLVKMASDFGDLDRLGANETKLGRNPLMLDHSLDELSAMLECPVLDFPVETIWRRLDRPSTYMVRQYTAALWILREEAHVQRRQAPRMLEALAAQVKPPDPASVRADCLDQTASEELAVGGCWKRPGVRIENAASVASPVAKLRSRALFLKRIRSLEQHFKENCEAQVRKRHAMATEIQRIVRGRLAKRRIHQDEKRAFVAQELQRHWRGGRARMAFADRKASRADEIVLAPVLWELARRENAALRVQCVWRRVVATCYVQMVREDHAVTRMSAWYRCKAQRWRHVQYLAARRIQTAARGRLAWMELLRRRLARRQKLAAIRIQSVARAKLARRVREDLRRDRAACRIQGLARRFVARSLAYKAVYAQRLIMAWRQHRARRIARERRRFLAAVRRVQTWHRVTSEARKLALEARVASWRNEHTSLLRKLLLHNMCGVPWSQGCALFDHERALQQQLGKLRRTASARDALGRLEARIKQYAARMRALNVSISYAPMRAMLKVKAKYEQLLVLTKHLSAQELADAEETTSQELDALQRRIAHIEELVRVAIKARSDYEIATRVTDIQEYVLCKSPTEIGAFHEAYKATRKREKVLAAMGRNAELAEARWKQMLVEAEWTHRPRVEMLEAGTDKARKDLRKRNARLGAAQISSHVRGRGLLAATERRAEAKRSVRISKQLEKRIAAMAEEDAYSEAHRGYLAASPAAMRAAHNRFEAFERPDSGHRGEITPADFQKLAFDLGIVVPMSRVRDFVDRVDLNGNKLIDWDEFALWYFCCSQADKVRFQFSRMGTKAGAVQMFHAGGLTTKLRVNQASRKAIRLARTSTSSNVFQSLPLKK